MAGLFAEAGDNENVIGELAEKYQRMPWEIRDYKLTHEVGSRDEWEELVQEAEQQLEGTSFLDYTLHWQQDKPATDVAKLVAIRRRLARDLNATSIIELMYVDLMAANYQMQCDWLELMGTRTHILHRTYPNRKGDPKVSFLKEWSQGFLREWSH